MAVLHAIAHARRDNGLQAFATIDAGPHVKVLCRAADVTTIAQLVGTTPGVLDTLVASPGPGAEVIEEAS